MLELQNALIQFFKQFTNNVFVVEAVDPTGILFPRIVFRYATTDLFGNTQYTFQIFSRSTSTLESLLISKKIEQALPVMSGTKLSIGGGAVYEYFNYHTDKWVVFDLDNFNAIFQQHVKDFPPQQYPDKPFQWREAPGKVSGAIRLYRGSPFIQQQPSDDSNIVIFYGNIEARSLLI